MKCLPTRRAVLAAGAMTVVGHGAVWAQESNRTYRLGVLAGLPRGAPQSGVVVADLGKAGFIVGKNLIIDWRLQGSPEQTTASVRAGATGSRRAVGCGYPRDGGGTGRDPDDSDTWYRRRHGRERTGPV